MLGTAFPAARVLLVEQPGAWGRGGLGQSGFDAAVATRLEARAAAAGVRVVLIRRPGRTPRGATRRWALADTADDARTLRWGLFGDDGELLELPLDGSVGETDEAPLYLVCAHSKHDACCALRGRPVAAALHDARPGRVWECSHLGGERFAANVLVLPTGLLYGRVLPFAATGFVAAAEAGEVVGALLRGKVGLPPAAQAALAYAHEHLAVREVGALRVEGTSAVVDGAARVRLATPGGPMLVEVRVDVVTAPGLTCQNPAPGRYLAHHPVRIVPVDG